MFRTIVVGDDGSEGAARALRRAIALAERCDADLHVIGVVRPMPVLAGVPGAAVLAVESEAELEDRLRAHLEECEDALRRRGVRATVHALRGDPAATLVGVAEERAADLIVVGSKGMRGVRRALGSVPNSVSHRAECSVLIVRTD